MPTASTRKRSKQEFANEDQELALTYAGSLIHRAMLDIGEKSKATDIAKAAGRSDLDTRLARVVLSSNPHMTATDRQWTLWSRFDDERTSTQAQMIKVLSEYGQPIPRLVFARELANVFHRPAEIYEELLRRLVDEDCAFFDAGNDTIASTTWLLRTELHSMYQGAQDFDAEVQFENYVSDEDLATIAPAVHRHARSIGTPEAIAAALDEAGGPVANLALQLAVWMEERDTFDAEAVYRRIYASGAYSLPGPRWIGPATCARLAGHFAELAEREVSDTAEQDAQKEAEPLVIHDADRETLAKSVLANEETTFAEQLLQDVFDVAPTDRTWDSDLKTLVDALRADTRVLYVGADRFRDPGSVPPYARTVPASLEIPHTRYTDADGEPIDNLIEDDGFDSALQKDILSVFAQDVLDEEPVPKADTNPPSTARAVIKFHHKQIGTMPLCQFPSGFFPSEPVLLETEFTLPGNHLVQVWVNNETRLLYGLLDWFSSIPIDSGATFTLERYAPDKYSVSYNEESEPAMFVSSHRLTDLQELQRRAETESLANFDILREITEHYRKGIEFITLLTEANLVRRMSRRMIASLLSSYHCFFLRNGAWVLDHKKLDQGFDKSKRKYLVKG